MKGKKQKRNYVNCFDNYNNNYANIGRSNNINSN